MRLLMQLPELCQHERWLLSLSLSLSLMQALPELCQHELWLLDVCLPVVPEGRHSSAVNHTVVG